MMQREYKKIQISETESEEQIYGSLDSATPKCQ
jgi:hypothetical protein